MKPFGIKKQDCRCCPGHDKHPVETYNSRLSIKARSRGKQIAHQRGRALNKVLILSELKEIN